MNKSEIGNTIKDRRRFLGITQKELSEIAGLGLRSYVAVENGNGNPTIEQLRKIFSALGLTMIIKANKDE